MANEAPVAPAAPAAQVATETPAAPSANTEQPVDYKAKYDEIYKQKEELERIVTNADAYFSADEVARQRLEKWHKGDKLDPWPSQEPVKEQPKKAELDTETLRRQLREEIAKELRGEIEQQLTPLQVAQAEVLQERDRKSLQDEYPWLNAQKYKEFEDKFQGVVNDKAKEIMQMKRVPPARAYEEAMSHYASFSQKELLVHLMMDDIVANATQAKRGSSALPKGMVNRSPNDGTTPDAMDEARKFYVENQDKDPKTIAKGLEGYAEKLGMDLMDLYKKLQ